MEDQDIRWQQRLTNFNKALLQLTNAVFISQQRELTNLEKQGLVKGFEYTHELAWNVMKDFLMEEGFKDIIGSKSATREAFKQGLIIDGDNWMEMIKSRNLTSHTYQEETANKITSDIINIYYQLFVVFQKRMEELKSNQ